MQNNVTQNTNTENKQMSTKTKIILIVLGIIFLPVLLTVIIAKSKKIKTPIKAGLIAIVWLITLIVGAVNSDNTEPVVNESSSYYNEELTDFTLSQFEATEEPTTVPFFADIENQNITIEVGETEELSVIINHNDISAEEITFENSDENVVAIKNTAVTNNDEDSILTFTCSAVTSGSANIRIYIPSEDVYSDYFFVTAKITPKVETFGFLTTYTQRMEEDESLSYTIELSPGTVTEDDFEFFVSDTSIISVYDVKITNEDEKTMVEFSVYANSAGSATLQLKAIDGLTESSEMSFEVEEKDTSPTVYTTPSGEKYHYSKSCAGKNAIEKTLNTAIAQGYDPCKKCA